MWSPRGRFHSSVLTLSIDTGTGCIVKYVCCASRSDNPNGAIKTYLGTKSLIECQFTCSISGTLLTIVLTAFYDEQERALESIRNSLELSKDEKKRFFKSANHNLGTTALCLSGGASFGYCKPDNKATEPLTEYPQIMLAS